jgi:hypothetical protein
MNIAYQNEEMFGRPTGWLRGELITSGNAGYSRIQTAEGEILSIQEGGGYDTRPPDTDGPWEQCKRSGNVVSYNHDGEIFGIVIMEI